MTGAPGHFCPGCGAPLGAFLRYPWHFCAACRDSAVDGAGRGLLFGNEGLSGGFMFRYAEDAARGADGGWIACRGVIARIAGRPVRITEARFGGVVAEPVNSSTGHMRVFERNSVVLTGGPVMEAARQRLVPRNDKR